MPNQQGWATSKIANVTPDTIVLEARKYLGVPFKHGGRDPESGLDCVGLFLRVARSLGVIREEYDCPKYGRSLSANVIVPQLRQVLDEIPKDKAKKGDVYLIGMLGLVFGIGFITNDDPVTVITVDGQVCEMERRLMASVPPQFMRQLPAFIRPYITEDVVSDACTLAAFRFRQTAL